MKLIAIVILAGLIVLFIVQNVATVEIQFLLWSVQMPRSILIFALLSVGVIIGWSLSSLRNRKRRS